jgi:hypothetical protein
MGPGLAALAIDPGMGHHPMMSTDPRWIASAVAELAREAA